MENVVLSIMLISDDATRDLEKEARFEKQIMKLQIDMSFLK